MEWLAASNPLWGAPRIHGELLKLGIDVSRRTIGRLLPKHRKPPSQTWRTFLGNHAPDLAALDFFSWWKRSRGIRRRVSSCETETRSTEPYSGGA